MCDITNFKFSGLKKKLISSPPSGEDNGSFNFFKRTANFSAGWRRFFKFLPAVVNFHRVYLKCTQHKEMYIGYSRFLLQHLIGNVGPILFNFPVHPLV